MRPARCAREDVRQMLGLADRTRVIDLFEALMRGDVAAALKELRAQYDIGADPAVVLPTSPSSRISSPA
jgi:DNA polymerase-3 subunit gamma/tau